jgi:hypothetical protein
LAKLVTILLEKPFQKRGLDFIRPTKPASKFSNNNTFWWPFDCATKWVEAKTFRTHTTTITTKFLYEYILAKFGCPLTIMMDQGTHFINDVIKYLTNHFIFRHINCIVYYLQGNG